MLQNQIKRTITGPNIPVNFFWYDVGYLGQNPLGHVGYGMVSELYDGNHHV